MSVSVPDVFALSCNFRTMDVATLEQLSLSRERLDELYVQGAFSSFSECVVLSTCNRVEIYATGENVSFEKIAEKLSEISNLSADLILKMSERVSGVSAVQHLFEVTAGLDSRMVGETEILGQVKQAYETAFSMGTSGAVLNRVFQKSFHVAKWARANTGISQGQVSIGNVAVELAGRVFGALSRCTVLVVGTGEAGRKTAQSFVSRGAGNVLTASRNFEHARQFAAEIGAGAIELDSIATCATHADIVVGCSSVSEPIISEKGLTDVLRARGDRPLFLIDLGMPRNFPSNISADELWIYDLGDLAKIANENLSVREREAESCRRELIRRARRIFDSLQIRRA